jgi:hypothetical protein
MKKGGNLYHAIAVLGSQCWSKRGGWAIILTASKKNELWPHTGACLYFKK